MNFHEAEQQFQALEKAFREGRVSPEAYQKQLANLSVTDARGAAWQMQAHTGRWHVYLDGKWQPALPPHQVRRQPVQPGPVPPKKKGINTLLILAGVVGLCLLCGLVAAGGYYIYDAGYLANTPLADLFKPSDNTQGTTQKGGSQAPVDDAARVKPIESITVAADGSTQTDANGVAITVPQGIVPGQSQVEFTAQQLDAKWVDGLQKMYSIDTPFYSVAVQGAEDSTGRLELDFPAVSPASRLVVVIDGQYLVQTNIDPSEGRLKINVRSGATQPDPASPYVDDQAASIYYTVITPRQGSNGSSSNIRARLQVERFCMPDMVEGVPMNICRQNPSGSIHVTLPLDSDKLLPQVDKMIDKMEAAMTRYASLNFSSAKISRSYPMIVRIFSGAGDPKYKPQNGVLYIPEDVVKNVDSNDHYTLYHEMAHWIQDEEYAMIPAFYSHPRHWWLEVSAETMVMLLDPDYTNLNLTTYGSVTNDDGSLVLQSTPYQWPTDFYVQAQLVRINICDSAGCALTQDGFVSAINGGSYPLMDSGKQSVISKSIDDYARYLLGKAPLSAYSGMPLGSAVTSGQGYGESVDITRTTKADFDFIYSSGPPQLKKGTKDGVSVLEINAKIAKDGVYPLTLKAAEEKYSGYPVMIEIQPGVPFYYTTNNGDVQFSDGTKEVKIQPIHTRMGYSLVRISAMGKEGEKQFKAVIKPVDLTGVWVIEPESVVSNNVQCSKPAEEGESSNPGMMGVILTKIVGAMGDMKPGPTGTEYTWALNSSRLLPDSDSSDFTYTASVKQVQSVFRYQGDINVPRKSESSIPSPLGITVAGVVCLPVLWWGSRHARGKLTLIVCGIVLVLGLAGCFSLMIYGQVGVQIDYDKMEYFGGEETGVVSFANQGSTTPLWKLSGLATYNINLTFETSTEDMEGNEQIEKDVCSGTATFRVVTNVYKDVTIQTEDNDG